MQGGPRDLGQVRACRAVWGGTQDGSRAVGMPWGHRMSVRHMERAPGVVLGMHNGSWAARWLLGHSVGSGHLGWPRVKLVAGPMGTLGEKGVGVGDGGLGQQPSRVSQCFFWGTGLSGAGICGTGRGDWVPAGTPGETPNVSHTLWCAEVRWEGPTLCLHHLSHWTPPCMSCDGDSGHSAKHHQLWDRSPSPDPTSCP